MTDTTKPIKILFDEEPCGRCGGTGQHQYNQRDGRVCWGCNGTRVRLSRRGKAAFEAFEEALAASAGTVAVQDIKPGMIIKCQAHGGVVNGTQPWDYKPAWRQVESVKIEQCTFRETGVRDGYRVDVEGWRAEIVFEGGKTWWAESSDDPAYWAKGAGHTIYAQRSFLVGGEEARAARDAVRVEIARRFKGAWLEGEEAPAPAAPRLRKSADVEKPEPRTFPNRFPGTCARPGCGQRVEAEAGERFKGESGYVTQHKAGECPEAPETAPEETPAPRPLPANLYAGDCHKCGARVEAQEGERLKLDGRWAVQHKGGECPAPQAAEEAPTPAEGPQEVAPAADGAPHIVITRAKLYPEVSRPGPAWQWSYHYTVDGGPNCQYGPGLASLRDMLRRKFGTTGVEAWKNQERPAPAPAEPATDEGIYRHGGALYRVRRGPSGNLYAHTITHDQERQKVTFTRAPGVARRLSAGERLGLAEVEEISALWDSCALCGAEMTVSKGIGPVCRKRV